MSSAIKEAGKSEREELGTRMMARAGKQRPLESAGNTRPGTGAGKYAGATNGGNMRNFFPYKKKKELN